MNLVLDILSSVPQNTNGSDTDDVLEKTFQPLQETDPVPQKEFLRRIATDLMGW